jgi:hypothetical protein
LKQFFENQAGFTDEEIIRELLQFRETTIDLTGGKITVLRINDLGNIEKSEETLVIRGHHGKDDKGRKKSQLD